MHAAYDARIAAPSWTITPGADAQGVPWVDRVMKDIEKFHRKTQ
jgi:hypothetical protein